MLSRTFSFVWGRRTAAGLWQQIRNESQFCFPESPPSTKCCSWTEMPNGVRLMTELTCSNLATVGLFIKAGSRYEIDCNNGGSHFIGHLAYSGVRNFNRRALEDHVLYSGSVMDSRTTREYQALTCTCPSDQVLFMIQYYYKMLYELDCNPVEIARARENVFSELNEVESNPEKLCFDYLHQTAFQGTPMARSHIGPMANYCNFEPDFVVRFMEQHYQPYRMAISVSSCYTHQQVIGMMNCTFCQMNATACEPEDLDCRYTGSIVRVRNDDMPYCHVAMAVETGGYDSDDFMGLQIMKHIIGHWGGSHGQGYNTWPLLAHASELSKLCFSFKSFYIPYEKVGLWGIYFVIRREDDIEDMILMVQDTWIKMAYYISDEDVKRGKHAYLQEILKSSQGCFRSCYDMGLQSLYWGGRKSLSILLQDMSLWFSPEIGSLADKVIYDKCPVISAIGPTESVPDYNRIRAGMYQLRL